MGNACAIIASKGYLVERYMKNKAFSLSEMVAIIVVLGVIFALIFPTTMSSFEQRTLNIQRKTFEEKFTRGLQEMRMGGKLALLYPSTDDFVRAMRDYFQIAKVCSNNNLSECFPSGFTAKAIYNDMETARKNFDTSAITDSKSLSNSFSEVGSKVVGVKFSDGTSTLITIKPNCTGPDRTDVNGNIFQCIGYVADANGNKAPNTTGDDLLTNMALVNPFNLDFIIIGDKYWNRDEVGTAKGPYYENDYWLGAKLFCEKKGGSLPTTSQLEKIANLMYGENCKKDSGRECDFSKTKSTPMYRYLLGETNSTASVNNNATNPDGIPVMHLWSNEEYSDQLAVFLAMYQGHWTFYRTVAEQGRSAHLSHYKTICVK